MVRGCVTIVVVLCSLACASLAQQSATTAQQPAAMAVSEWIDDFDGASLDPAKWERFSFDGPSGGTVKTDNGVLHIRGLGGSRFGVRSVPEFRAEKFLVEASLPNPPAATDTPMAFAVLAVMFDSAGRNRIEWIFRSDSHFEAWIVRDGRSEQLDNRRLATTVKNPTLAIARRAGELLFLLNGEVGVQKSIKDLPREFHVMLYGFGTSQNDWDSVRVVTPVAPAAGK